jgi:hypothetical protein
LLGGTKEKGEKEKRRKENCTIFHLYINFLLHTTDRF